MADDNAIDRVKGMTRSIDVTLGLELPPQVEIDPAIAMTMLGAAIQDAAQDLGMRPTMFLRSRVSGEVAGTMKLSIGAKRYVLRVEPHLEPEPARCAQPRTECRGPTMPGVA